MCKNLEALANIETTLLDELKTLDLYMNIENFRFSNSINYDVICNL